MYHYSPFQNLSPFVQSQYQLGNLTRIVQKIDPKSHILYLSHSIIPQYHILPYLFSPKILFAIFPKRNPKIPPHFSFPWVLRMIDSVQPANSNKYNNKMQQCKSPKSLAYARLGRPQSGKSSVVEQHKKIKRNSTGNIYDEIMGQIPQAANSYIRQLVSKNQKESTPMDAHLRRKSYAEIAIDSKQKKREERDTLCKAKPIGDVLLQQVTPKNSTLPLSKKSKLKSSNSSVLINSFKPQNQPRSFLDNLADYIEELAQPQQIGGQKLSQTLKIRSGEGEPSRLASKLQQSQLKVKQLRLKNYYLQKEGAKKVRKQERMKQSLFQMLSQIKHLTAQLSFQKNQRKRLQRIVDSFEMRSLKPQRRTIGRHQRLQDFQDDLNTQNDLDRDLDSSFREYVKNSLQKRKPYNTMKRYDNDRRMGMLDSQKIEKLFRSNYNSDDSED